MSNQTSFNFNDIEQMADVVESWMFKADMNTQREFIDTPKEDLIKYHTSLGRSIRNHFDLWGRRWEPQLEDKGGYQVDMSPDHPDSISMRIIETVWTRNQKD